MKISTIRQRSQRRAGRPAAPLHRRGRGLPRRPWLVADDEASARPGAMLEGEAEALVRLFEATPPTWATAGFAQSVDAVRSQLEPIPSIDALVSSRSRESHAQPGSSCASRSAADRLADCPVEVAYALRWIELTDGPVPAWAELLRLVTPLPATRATPGLSMSTSETGAGEPVLQLVQSALAASSA